jgi:membrane-bound serine protease (ClpP class)
MVRSVAVVLVTWALSPLPTAHAQERPVVYRISVSGSVEVDLSDLVASTLQAAEGEPGSVVVLDIGSSGGRMDIAQLIIGDLQRTSVPVYALVNNRAWQAAALIALAADSIFVVEDASIGAGDQPEADQPRMPDAALDALRRDFGTLAARQGVDPEIGEAMVDEAVEVRGVVRRNQLLTLGAADAVELGLAAGHVVDLDDMLMLLGVVDPSVQVVGETKSEGVTVEIVNYHLSNVRIVLTRGGARHRLGIVATNGSATFEIAESILPDGARIQVVAEVIGGSGRVETDEILARPGLVIQWNIETRLSQSNFFYFVR